MSLKSCGWNKSFPFIPTFPPRWPRSNRSGKGEEHDHAARVRTIIAEGLRAIFAPLFGQRGWRLSALFSQMSTSGSPRCATWRWRIFFSASCWPSRARANSRNWARPTWSPISSPFPSCGRSAPDHGGHCHWPFRLRITAELGTMKVAEEIEALNVNGHRPGEVSRGARLLAMILMMPVLTRAGRRGRPVRRLAHQRDEPPSRSVFYVANSIDAVEQKDLFTACSRR